MERETEGSSSSKAESCSVKTQACVRLCVCVLGFGVKCISYCNMIRRV